MRRPIDRIMTGRLAYLLRFVAVTFGSFLLGKTLFILYNHKLSGTMSLGDFLGVLFCRRVKSPKAQSCAMSPPRSVKPRGTLAKAFFGESR